MKGWREVTKRETTFRSHGGDSVVRIGKRAARVHHPECALWIGLVGWMRFGVLDLTGQRAGYPREQIDPTGDVQCIKYLTLLKRPGRKDVGRKGVRFSFTKMADLIWDQIWDSTNRLWEIITVRGKGWWQLAPARWSRIHRCLRGGDSLSCLHVSLVEDWVLGVTSRFLVWPSGCEQKYLYRDRQLWTGRRCVSQEELTGTFWL